MILGYSDTLGDITVMFFNSGNSAPSCDRFGHHGE